MERDAAAVAGDDVPSLDGVVEFHLEFFHRRIDVADGAARRAFLAEDVPRLQRGAEFEVDAVVGDFALERKAEFEVRREPFRLEGITAPFEIVEDVVQVLGAEMGQEETVVQLRSPRHGPALVGLFPEPRHQPPA